jgi:predicted ATPase
LNTLQKKTKFTKEEITLFSENMNISPLFKNNLATYSPIKDLKFDTSRVNILEEEREIEMQNIRYLFLVEHKWLQWSQLSDGTKRLFYIISHLTYQKDSIFLIEEPELGIHPHQLYNLMRFIKKEAETKQIIVTTHSPQVLNVLHSDELERIIVCEATENGTKMRHLTPQQTKRAQKYMASELSLGDYWLHADLEPQNMLR